MNNKMLKFALYNVIITLIITGLIAYLTIKYFEKNPIEMNIKLET